MDRCKHCGGTGKEPDHRKIGATMRAIRETFHRSLKSVAQDLCISPSYLSDLELGKRGWNEKLKQRFKQIVTGELK
jgi:predicted transcriptional regulator